MKDLLNGAVRVRFPDGAAPTLRTLMKDRLAPNRESQIRTPLLEMRDPGLSPVAARGSNAHRVPAIYACERTYMQ